uniref:Dienelactone hydrolase domain-containing protein n=1 Tax=Alexandrium catenella TaxID=2925 RepID=A0A7S1RPQ9_ALECA
MDALLRDPEYWRSLMAAYLAAAYAHAAVSAGRGGAIGYCLGGQCLLEQVRAGHALQAVVSFHGLLHSRPRHSTEDRRLTPQEYEREVKLAPNSYSTRCKVLIEHGDLDDRPGRDAQSIADWKVEMDAHGIDWRFHRHAQARHGFALPPGMISEEYSEVADRRSTLAMLSLFAEVWPDCPQFPVEANACGTRLGQGVATTRARL